jgi:hypothetical protein
MMGTTGWQQHQNHQQSQEIGQLEEMPSRKIGNLVTTGSAQHSPRCCRATPIGEEEESAANTIAAGYSSHIFVALYDFHGVGDEKLSLRKGDQVFIYNWQNFD